MLAPDNNTVQAHSANRSHASKVRAIFSLDLQQFVLPRILHSRVRNAFQSRYILGEDAKSDCFDIAASGVRAVSSMYRFPVK